MCVFFLKAAAIRDGGKLLEFSVVARPQRSLRQDVATSTPDDAGVHERGQFAAVEADRGIRVRPHVVRVEAGNGREPSAVGIDVNDASVSIVADAGDRLDATT